MPRVKNESQFLKVIIVIESPFAQVVILIELGFVFYRLVKDTLVIILYL